MWHELVMHGIGGRTVAEAQSRMSYTEFCRWLAYRRKRGSLHPGLRADRGAAMLATLYANAHRKKSDTPLSLYTFLPFEEEPPITLERAMELWH
ncbi:hypothetical protein MKP05_09390 [Halomonas sp. EGI 63088]|uniref:Minor tail T domain-containing protein n=1 Tax=Halomonas flagellata TaxID=2920385 RepID=A0ABS9RU57_9GAMM|nr:hypothetical protein [Halomonas flagellata]MCH4563342.1 hypothetical protein [Halomonas flagellata]